jgi:acetyl-CoA carboxylase biotin carboxyl carrier protein
VDLKQIKELMAAMEKAGMKKLTLKEKTGFELHLEREDEYYHGAGHSSSHMHHHPMFISHPVPKPHDITHPVHPPLAEGVQAASAKVEGKFVTAPMVGTLYSAPSPEDPVFVKVGDQVDEGTVVCIIEAMKVMNEVKAGCSGTIAEICVENGHPVEFGTKLFRIV